MKITDALLGEHGVLYSLMSQIEKIASEADTIEAFHGAAKIFGNGLLTHARIEESLLFPALEKHMGPAGPLDVMKEEHSEIESLTEQICDEQDLHKAQKTLHHLLELTRSHFEKEEQILFRLSEDHLPPEDLQSLGRDWSNERNVSI